MNPPNEIWALAVEKSCLQFATWGKHAWLMIKNILSLNLYPENTQAFRIVLSWGSKDVDALRVECVGEEKKTKSTPSIILCYMSHVATLKAWIIDSSW